jgi:hypothetical protein
MNNRHPQRRKNKAVNQEILKTVTEKNTCPK